MKSESETLLSKVNDELNKPHRLKIGDIDSVAVQTIVGILDIVSDTMSDRKRCQDTYQEYQEKLKELSKDSRVKELEDEIAHLRFATFEFSEIEKAGEWKRLHNIKFHGADDSGYVYTGASGGQFLYEFHPTGVGMFYSCRCGQCYEKYLKAKYSKNTSEKDLKQLLENSEISFDDC